MSKAINWGDMKRVLVEVKPTKHGARYDMEMNEAANRLLKKEYVAALGSHRDYWQSILAVDTRERVGLCRPCRWLPAHFGDCPPQFVLCAPREFFRADVPDYTGPVK